MYMHATQSLTQRNKSSLYVRTDMLCREQYTVNRFVVHDVLERIPDCAGTAPGALTARDFEEESK
jgi:hypothetical protein